MTNTGSEIWDNTTDPTEIKLMIKECYKELYTPKFDNLDKIDTFFRGYKLSSSL